MDPVALNAWRALLSSWDALLLTFVLVVIVPTLSYLRFRRSVARGDQIVLARTKLRSYSRVIFQQWLLVALMLLILRHHGVSIGDAGQRLANARLTLGVTLALLLILAVVSALILTRLRHAQAETLSRAMGRMRRLAPTFGAEMVAFAVLCLTAGICEELLYRGWLVSILWVATDSVWVAVVVGAVVFGIGHAYLGPLAVLRAAFVGLQLGVLFAWVGSLVPGQVLHAGVDVLVGVAGAFAMSRLNLVGAEPPEGCSTDSATSS